MTKRNDGMTKSRKTSSSREKGMKNKDRIGKCGGA